MTLNINKNTFKYFTRKFIKQLKKITMFISEFSLNDFEIYFLTIIEYFNVFKNTVTNVLKNSKKTIFNFFVEIIKTLRDLHN